MTCVNLVSSEPTWPFPRHRRGIATWCFANPPVALPDSQKDVLSDARRWLVRMVGQVDDGWWWMGWEVRVGPWKSWKISYIFICIVVWCCWLSTKNNNLKLIVKDLETIRRCNEDLMSPYRQHLDMVDLWKFDLGILLVDCKLYWHTQIDSTSVLEKIGMEWHGNHWNRTNASLPSLLQHIWALWFLTS